jgi:type IV pilus assembly protein PilV
MTIGRHPRANQDGALLIEVLIAMLIFSMGILALLGLQAASISNTTSAKYRSDASYLVDQIISDMWASGTLANLAGYACNPCDTNAGNGNAATQKWASDVQNSLPKVGIGAVQWPQITVSTPAGQTNANQVTVQVWWQAPNDPTVHSYQVTTQICPGDYCS